MWLPSPKSGSPHPRAAPVTSARRISGKVISQFKPESDNGTVIAIGASTGGTEAILEVLKQFPVNMPGIVITQHMPAGFTAMYAERLNRLCKLE
ncbi:MAG: chemotaxis protein CheB, partial [Enterocloster sp.]